MAYQIRLCFSLAYAGCSLKVCSVAASCPRIKLGLLSKFHHGPPLANPYLLFPASFLAMLPTCIFCSGPLLKCTTPFHILLPIHRQLLPAMPFSTSAAQGIPTQLKPSRFLQEDQGTWPISFSSLIPFIPFGIGAICYLVCVPRQTVSSMQAEDISGLSLSPARHLTSPRAEARALSVEGDKEVFASEPAQGVSVGMVFSSLGRGLRKLKAPR